MSKEELEKLEREKYVVERKLTAAMHKEKRLQSELKRFFRGCQRVRDTFILSPGNGVLNAYKRPKSTQRRNHVRQPKILLPQAERELL